LPKRDPQTTNDHFSTLINTDRPTEENCKEPPLPEISDIKQVEITNLNLENTKDIILDSQTSDNDTLSPISNTQFIGHGGIA
jgi:hypothetical protein